MAIQPKLTRDYLELHESDISFDSFGRELYNFALRAAMKHVGTDVETASTEVTFGLDVTIRTVPSKEALRASVSGATVAMMPEEGCIHTTWKDKDGNQYEFKYHKKSPEGS